MDVTEPTVAALQISRVASSGRDVSSNSAVVDIGAETPRVLLSGALQVVGFSDMLK